MKPLVGTPSPGESSPRGPARQLLIWSSVLLGLVVSWLALGSEGSGGLLVAAKALDLRLLAVVAVVLGEAALRVWRFQVMASAVEERISLPQALRITLAGDFASGISPGRVGGEPTRWYGLTQLGIPAGRASAILTGEFPCDVLFIAGAVPGVILLALCTGVAAPTEVSWGWLLGAVIGPPICLAGLGYAAVNHLKRLVKGLAGLIRRLPAATPWLGRRRELVAEKVERAERDWRERLHWLVRHGKRRWALALLLTIAFGVVRLAILPSVAWALHLDIGLPPLLLWACAVYFGLAFIPLPGGGGTTEAASLAYLHQYLPGAEAALLLAVWRLFDYYLRLAVGGLAALGLKNWQPDLTAPAPIAPVESS